MQDMWVQSLGWEDPPEKETATHSSILCLENPMDRGFWQAGFIRSHRVRNDWSNLVHTCALTGKMCTLLSLVLILQVYLYSYKSRLRLVRGFPGGASGKEPAWQCRRPKRHSLDPWVRKMPGGGHGNPLQYSYWRISWTEGPGRLMFKKMRK